MPRYSIAAKQQGNVVLEPNSVAQALTLAREGAGEYEPDEGGDIELDLTNITVLEENNLPRTGPICHNCSQPIAPVGPSGRSPETLCAPCEEELFPSTARKD